MVGGRWAGNLEQVYLVANLEQQQLELSEEASSPLPPARELQPFGSGLQHPEHTEP